MFRFFELYAMSGKANHQKLILRGALTGLWGFVLSGPVAVLLVTLIHPQPEWISALVFVDHYHPIQNLPYFLGFLIPAGMLMLGAGHYLHYADEPPATKSSLLLALALTIVFTGLIAFNYICQTTFVHNLASNYQPEYASLIAGFSMSNPASFCWANEMWGYAFLGIATWLTAPCYKEKNNFIRSLLIANGIISLISPVWTILDVSWVLTPTGITLYLVWNLLMIVLMVAIARFTLSSMKQGPKEIDHLPDTA
jgi:hypothetical protein